MDSLIDRFSDSDIYENHQTLSLIDFVDHSVVAHSPSKETLQLSSQPDPCMRIRKKILDPADDPIPDLSG